MDIDTGPLLSSEETFNELYPLPFRISLLTSLSVFAFASNMHLLELVGLDVVALLDLRPAHVEADSVYVPMYKFGLLGALWTAFCWLVLHGYAGADDETREMYVVLLMWGVALFVAFMPFNLLHKQLRMRFIRSLKRLLLSPLNAPVPFSDVILADILTSSAKVLGDIAITVCIYARTDTPSCSKGWGVPFLTALPYVIRFRQCTSEVWNGAGLKSAANAVKYATAFPVIVLSAMQTGDLFDDETGATKSHTVLSLLWMVSVFVNSLYSFWWDLTNDWGLSILSLSRHGSHAQQYQPLHVPTPRISHVPRHSRAFSTSSRPSSYPFLRSILLLPDPYIYYFLIVLDLVLRFTWSLKLSRHLHEIHERESGIFALEALEVMRRWAWVMGRIEWEAVRKGYGSVENGDEVGLGILVQPGGSGVPHSRSTSESQSSNGKTILPLSIQPPQQQQKHHSHTPSLH